MFYEINQTLQGKFGLGFKKNCIHNGHPYDLIMLLLEDFAILLIVKSLYYQVWVKVQYSQPSWFFYKM